MNRPDAILTGVVVVAALSLGSWVNSKLPSPGDIRSQPFEHTGKLGEAVNLRTGTLTVRQLDAAPRISATRNTLGYNVAISKDGTFLVVGVDFTANKVPSDLSVIEILSSDGRTFGGTPPVGQSNCGTAQPGIPLSCQLVYEIDKKALAGAKLRAEVGSGNDDTALIDLGIDDAQARALAGRSKMIQVSPPQVKP